MKIDVVYPPRGKRRPQRRDLIAAARWPFLFAAYICPIVNLFTGGKAWSLIVLWSLLLVWKLLLSPDLVEYNRISQVIKLIVYSVVLLCLIDRLLSPGWAIEVVPIVCFAGLTASGVLFFTDLERQKQNMLPLLLLSGLCLAGAVAGLIFWHEESRWAFAVMGAFAFALLAACFAVLGPDMLRELKKRFHTQ